MAERAELGDTFGNYLLHGIDEVFMPQAISMWPQTIAWKILLGLLLLILFGWGVKLWRSWQHNQYRREAWSALDTIQSRINTGNDNAAVGVAELIKAVALCSFPREQVAQLTGQQWLSFLNAHFPKKQFTSSEVLLTVAYVKPQHWQLSQQQLLTLVKEAKQWVKSHRGSIS